jgi:hypothetical protein
MSLSQLEQWVGHGRRVSRLVAQWRSVAVNDWPGRARPGGAASPRRSRLKPPLQRRLGRLGGRTPVAQKRRQSERSTARRVPGRDEGKDRIESIAQNYSIR